MVFPDLSHTEKDKRTGRRLVLLLRLHFQVHDGLLARVKRAEDPGLTGSAVIFSSELIIHISVEPMKVVRAVVARNERTDLQCLGVLHLDDGSVQRGALGIAHYTLHRADVGI